MCLLPHCQLPTDVIWGCNMPLGYTYGKGPLSPTHSSTLPAPQCAGTSSGAIGAKGVLRRIDLSLQL